MIETNPSHLEIILISAKNASYNNNNRFAYFPEVGRGAEPIYHSGDPASLPKTGASLPILDREGASLPADR